MGAMRRSLFALLAAAGLVAGCGHATCPTPQPQDDLCGSGFYVKFDPFHEASTDLLRPFPNPLRAGPQPFKSATTGYSPDYPGDFGKLLDALDGFGPYAPAVLSFNEVLDPANLPQDAASSVSPSSPIYLVDLDLVRQDPSAPMSDVLHPFTAWYDATQAGAPVNSLVVAPWSPLEPKHEYALVVTDRLQTWLDPAHSTGTRCVGPSPAFSCVKSKSRVDPRVEPMRVELAPVFDWLEKFGIARGDVSLAVDYTTESVPDELLDVHSQVAAAAPPQPTFDPTRIFTNVSDPTTGKLVPEVKDYFQQYFPTDGSVNVDFDDYDFTGMGTIAYGHFHSTDWREPNFHVWLSDGDTGHVFPQGDNDLEFMMVLPKVDPANGIVPPFKTVVFQHALTVCKETMVAMGSAFNKRGIALVGIDVVNHGSRSEAAQEGQQHVCVTSALDFLQLDNPLETRENFRQTVADEFQFLRMVKSMKSDVDGDGVQDLDTSRVGFVSQSLGSIIGATFLSTEPDVGAGVLNVGGGGLYSLALSFFGSGGSTGPDGFSQLPTPLLDLMTILQTTLERADPIHFAVHAARDPFVIDGVKSAPKSVLLQEAVNDSVVGNTSTDALTREMGGELAGPTVFRGVAGVTERDAPFSGNVANGAATIAQTQFSPAKHQFLLELDNPGATCRGQMQAAIFLDSYFSTGKGTVLDAYTDPAFASCPTD